MVRSCFSDRRYSVLHWWMVRSGQRFIFWHFCYDFQLHWPQDFPHEVLQSFSSSTAWEFFFQDYWTWVDHSSCKYYGYLNYYLLFTISEFVYIWFQVIPCSFVKTHYPNGLPVKPVNLYVSDDFQWNVSMQNIDTNVCFSDGWIDFLTDLRLNVGDAICFELSENGRFKVTTFSKSGRQMRLFKILSVSNPDEKNNVVTLNPNVQQYPRLPGFTCNVTTELVWHLLIILL